MNKMRGKGKWKQRKGEGGREGIKEGNKERTEGREEAPALCRSAVSASINPGALNTAY